MDNSDEYRVGWLKWLLLVSSIGCLALLSLAAFQENFTASWRAHQVEYSKRLDQLARATETKTQRKSSANYPIKVRQVFLDEWKRVDRCVTCHVGIENPDFAEVPQPLTAHSGDILKHHPADKFGCTICHQGQGRATEKQAAHGHVPFWDKPLLVGDFVQATCAKCHHDEQVPQAPALSHGRQLIGQLGCAGCHKMGDIANRVKAGPQLDSIGSKVSRKWLDKWLTNPKDYLPQGKMPYYGLNPGAVDALASYLMTFRNGAIDHRPKPEGDYDTGANIYRESQCIVCHVTKLDYNDNPVGGQIGPNLLEIGNKVNSRWLVTFLKNPHSFYPNTKMPAFHFSDQEALDLSQYVMEEWIDYDLLDAEEQEPEPAQGTAEQIGQGKRLFAELGCGGCHDLGHKTVKPTGPDLTFIGSTPVHQLTFGDAKVPHTTPDFLYTKLKSPKSLHHKFKLPTEGDFAAAIWNNLSPAAQFSGSQALPDGSEQDRMAWVFVQAQRAGLLDASLKIADGVARSQAAWLVEELNKTAALNPLKMPNFQLLDEDAKALTIALMSLSDVSAPSKHFEAPRRPKMVFNPKDKFGKLERHYRCLSCHQIRDSGELLASDLTYEGSRVDREWLEHYLDKPYSMRRMLTIAMPIFHFPKEESRLMADYISYVFVDSEMGKGWRLGRAQADPERGKTLFESKGCLACHQLHGTGGDVGPSLTTQVPEFPHGTWVGDKLKGEWIYQWLKDPQALLPDTIEPNLSLSDQESLDLTAYLLSLKNPEYQQLDPAHEEPEAGEVPEEHGEPES